jgi:transposase
MDWIAHTLANKGATVRARVRQGPLRTTQAEHAQRVARRSLTAAIAVINDAGTGALSDRPQQHASAGCSDASHQAIDGMSSRLHPGVCVGTSSAQARCLSAQAFEPWSLRRPRVTIVTGLDQHRAQITADWVDTSTGESSRTRVAPADRAGVREFVARSRGQELEVALEATTGWRFVVEELDAVGARVHLAEPAETAARRGNKKRAKSDRADARHLRELLMIGRLPESWIAPEHILDLRARVRLRHTLSAQRGEWQQRIQAVLYHHGCPQRRNLMTGEGQCWLAAQPLPAGAREQVTVALAMIDALDVQLVPLTRELRAYARRQPGCRALMRHFGIGELVAVTILAELGDARRFSSSRDAVRYGGLDITVHQSDLRGGRPATCPARARPHCGGRCSRRRSRRPAPAVPTATTTARPRTGWAQIARPCRSPASCSSAATTRCASWGRRRCNRREFGHARAALTHTDAPRPAPPMLLPPRPRGRP